MPADILSAHSERKTRKKDVPLCPLLQQLLLDYEKSDFALKVVGTAVSHRCWDDASRRTKSLEVRIGSDGIKTMATYVNTIWGVVDYVSLQGWAGILKLS
jgi:hypothetical protein